MKKRIARNRDTNAIVWEIHSGDWPVQVRLQAVYPDGTKSIPQVFPIKFLKYWIRERNQENQSVLDKRA